MERFQAHEVTLAPNAAGNEFTRADLVFYGVEHRGPSFEARVFLNAPDANVDTPLDPDGGYGGSFVVFGHGGCFGDSGHCAVPTERDAFDKLPPHGMTPLTKLVEITDALKSTHAAGETIAVTVVPVQPGRRRARETDALFFTGLRLLTYR